MYTNYSGGAKGSDILWEIYGLNYNVKTVAFSFDGHSTISKFKHILTENELSEGWEKAKLAAIHLGRNIFGVSPYIKNLLARDWFQVKNSDEIFAIGKIAGEKVEGGTGYAVQLGILENKPVNVFNQIDNKWYKWDNYRFVERDIPILCEKFAGIGTRDISKDGEDAIKSVYKKTFIINQI